MTDKKYDDEGRGYLWHENDAVIDRKGSWTLEGRKEYGAIVKSYNAQGEVKYEAMVSIGLLHINADKKNDKSPDISGKVTWNNKIYKFGGWARESESGSPFTSVGFTPIDEETGKPQYTQEEKPPF